MDLVHHHRYAGPSHVSIERLFAEVRRNLPDPWNARVATCPHLSRGLAPRIANMRAARAQAGTINHITGDVHYLALALPSRGLVLTIHDCALLNLLKGPSREVFRRIWFTYPMRRVEVITTISEAMKKELGSHFPDVLDKIRVVPNCVRGEFIPAPKPFPEREPLILQVGTGWNKNLEGVAAALRGIPCRLEIIGKMSERQHEVLRLNAINYRSLGILLDHEVLDAYKRSDIMVFASLYEGFGLPIIEAQALGRPVITSNFGAMAEAAGSGALLVDPLNYEDLHQSVHKLFSDPDLRGRLIDEGFRNVIQYQPNAVASKYADLYEQLASNPYSS
jgi:glycosyltransferase involved in cell wall biosynthesis